MAVEHTEAVVLRGVDFSQTSRIVTFLTPGRGRVACMVKGARRLKGGQAAVLDTFNRVEISFLYKETRSVQTLTESALLSGYPGLKADLDKVSYASAPLEVALRTAHENEPSEALYAVLVEGLAGWESWSGPQPEYAAWLLLRILSVAGYEPALDHCCFSQKPVGDTAGFSFEGGVTVVAQHTDRRLRAEELAALRAMVRSAACPRVTGGARLVSLLCLYAERQLEFTLRSARVLEQMYGRANAADSR